MLREKLITFSWNSYAINKVPKTFDLDGNYPEAEIVEQVNAFFAGLPVEAEHGQWGGVRITPQWAAYMRRQLVDKKGLFPLDATAAKAAFSEFNRHFEPVTAPAGQLLETVRAGYSIAPVFSGRRAAENFREAWHIALDFDTEDVNSALSAHAADPLAVQLAAFAYTSPSHTPEAPRTRLVFILDRPIKRASSYEKAAAALQWQFDHADKSAKDAARLFYGAAGCQVWENWRELPIAVLAKLVKTWEQLTEAEREQARADMEANRQQRRASGQVDDLAGLFDHLAGQVAAAPDGQRHYTVWRIGRVLGGYIASGKLPAGEAEQLLYNAIDAMPGDASKADHKRTALDALQAGRAVPIEAGAHA